MLLLLEYISKSEEQCVNLKVDDYPVKIAMAM